ncbi:hypothetical protein BFAG_03279 [Bacteroides fragilis 3_1_12]|uniref:Transmembrane protein n=1 Tax=Bacteroides fragilis 3_1_12 TaxID=457424 RepID=A0ABN0BP11_BACFG|nr:hypothetical protein BFAG_03279 [Bacteroides fragilis 3_1_12]
MPYCCHNALLSRKILVHCFKKVGALTFNLNFLIFRLGVSVLFINIVNALFRPFYS